MTKQPLISILLPIKNEAPYISECVQSIISQDYKNIELIISDNCSTDSTWEIVSGFANEDTRIKAFRNETALSPYDNFMKCFNAFSGDLVHLIGGDDYIKDGFFSEVSKMFEADKNIFCVISKIVCFDDRTGGVIEIVPPDSFRNEIGSNVLDFCNFYINKIGHDELCLGVFRREFFLLFKHVAIASLESVGWWFFLFTYIKALRENQKIVFSDVQQIMKRYNKTYKSDGSYSEDMKAGIIGKVTGSVKNSIIAWNLAGNQLCVLIMLLVKLRRYSDKSFQLSPIGYIILLPAYPVWKLLRWSSGKIMCYYRK